MAQPQNVQPIKATLVTDYREVELRDPLVNCTMHDRKGQRVSLIRVEPDKETFVIKEHPAGVEIVGGQAWNGVIPWSNIKMAKR